MHVQQLLALALGADPDKDCGLDSHSQDVEPLLKRIGVRHTARAQAARANAGAPR
jgi:heterodisulfide reductase subunit B